MPDFMEAHMRYQLTPIYGFHVGCKTAIMLREAGFDAKHMKGGDSAWKAIDGPTKPHSDHTTWNP
jgi:hypothetical protein